MFSPSTCVAPEKFSHEQDSLNPSKHACADKNLYGTSTCGTEDIIPSNTQALGDNINFLPDFDQKVNLSLRKVVKCTSKALKG